MKSFVLTVTKNLFLLLNSGSMRCEVEVCDQRLQDWTHFEFKGGRLWVSWASSVIAGPGPSMESCGEKLWLPGTSWGDSIRASQAWNQSLKPIKGCPAPPLWTSHLGLCILSELASVCVCVSACVTKWIEGFMTVTTIAHRFLRSLHAHSWHF